MTCFNHQSWPQNAHQKYHCWWNRKAKNQVSFSFRSSLTHGVWKSPLKSLIWQKHLKAQLWFYPFLVRKFHNWKTEQILNNVLSIFHTLCLRISEDEVNCDISRASFWVTTLLLEFLPKSVNSRSPWWPPRPPSSSSWAQNTAFMVFSSFCYIFFPKKVGDLPKFNASMNYIFHKLFWGGKNLQNG